MVGVDGSTKHLKMLLWVKKLRQKQEEEWLPDPKGFERPCSSERIGWAGVGIGASVSCDFGGGDVLATEFPCASAREGRQIWRSACGCHALTFRPLDFLALLVGDQRSLLGGRCLLNFCYTSKSKLFKTLNGFTHGFGP